MSDIWDQIRSLDGHPLRTTKHHKIFRIALIPDQRDVIRICPESSQRSYRIDRAVFAQIVQAGLCHKSVTPDDVKRVHLTDWRTSYVASILAHLAR